MTTCGTPPRRSRNLMLNRPWVATRSKPAHRTIERDDGGAAALHLERPEALEGADVQRPHAAHVRRQPVAIHVGAQVEHPRGDEARGELLRVVPGDVVESLPKSRDRLRVDGPR